MLSAFLCSAVAWGAPSAAAEAHLGKGSELMRNERYGEAAVEFEQALSDDKTLEEARLNLAVCRFELRNYAEAQKLLGSLVTGKNSTLATYYLARIDLADGNFDSAIGRFRSIDGRSGSRDEKYFLGAAYCKKGQFAEAIEPLRQWIAASPRDFRAHELLARALNKLGRRSEAAREFARTKELHGYYLQGSIQMTNCRELLSAGKRDEAWAACQEMLNADDPDKASAIGLLFGEAGDNAHALAAWDKAVALDPESPEVNYNLALACFHVRDIARARRYAQTALALWPDFPEANVLYGTILYMLADDAEAIRVLTHAQQLRPDDASVRQLLTELRSHANAR